MSKIIKFDRHKITKKVTAQVNTDNLAYLVIICSFSLKDLRKLDMWVSKSKVLDLKKKKKIYSR